MKICHLSSVHKRYDTRIFVKECKSLFNAGNEVSLIVSDNKGDEVLDGVFIYDIGKENSRLKRITNTTRRIFKKALDLNCQIYHFHDPELITVGLKLIKKGRKVIYDVHEDVPRQILGKPYLNNFIKPIISRIFELYENFAAKKFSYILAATPYIRDRFFKLNRNTVDINNFPVIEELTFDKNIKKGDKDICYIGGITKIRGIYEIVDALNYTDAVLNLAGNFDSEDVRNEVLQNKGSEKIIEHGFVGRDKIKEILSKSKLGLVTLHPVVNYLDALPVKMFEYMLAGIPVIASNFKLWKQIIDETKCGICVNPLDSKEIADAINFLLDNEDEAKKMGQRGKHAVLKKYNWMEEERKLIKIYKNLK